MIWWCRGSYNCSCLPTYLQFGEHCVWCLLQTETVELDVENYRRIEEWVEKSRNHTQRMRQLPDPRASVVRNGYTVHSAGPHNHVNDRKLSFVLWYSSGTPWAYVAGSLGERQPPPLSHCNFSALGRLRADAVLEFGQFCWFCIVSSFTDSAQICLTLTTCTLRKYHFD